MARERHVLGETTAYVEVTSEKVECLLVFGGSRPLAPLGFGLLLRPVPEVVWSADFLPRTWAMDPSGRANEVLGGMDVFFRVRQRLRYSRRQTRPQRAPATPDDELRQREEDTLLQRVAKLMIAACEPHYRRLARRFHVQRRFDAYAAMVTDETGRMAQLADACPGAFLLFLATRDETHCRCADSIWDGARAGRKLGLVLGAALEDWLEQVRREPDDDGRPSWAEGLEGQRLERLFQQKRVLLRRAGPALWPGVVTEPPPLSFAPEDIPESAAGNARWFDVLCAPEVTWRSPSDALHEGLSAFLSRHAPRYRRWGLGLGHLPGDLARLCQISGLRLGRSTSPRTVRRVLDDWRRTLERIARSVELRERRIPEQLHATPLPRAPIAPAPQGCEIRALSSVAELVVEGRRMRHCVASMAASVLAGERHLYAVVIAGRRATLSLLPTGAGYRFEQASRACNRPLATNEEEILTLWASTLTPPRPEETTCAPPAALDLKTSTTEC